MITEAIEELSENKGMLYVKTLGPTKDEIWNLMLEFHSKAKINRRDFEQAIKQLAQVGQLHQEGEFVRLGEQMEEEPSIMSCFQEKDVNVPNWAMQDERKDQKENQIELGL